VDNIKYSKNSKTSKYIKSSLISIAFGELATIMALMLFSFAMAKIDVSVGGTNAIIIIAAALGGIVAGYLNGNLLKHKGIISGGVCGVVMCFILLIIKMIFLTPIPTGLTVLKLLAILIASAIGGIMGVNKKPKHIKY